MHGPPSFIAPSHRHFLSSKMEEKYVLIFFLMSPDFDDILEKWYHRVEVSFKFEESNLYVRINLGY